MHRDHVVTRFEAAIHAIWLPAQFGNGILVFRQHHQKTLADAALIRALRTMRETGNVAYEHAQETSDTGVRLPPHTHHTLSGIETQLFDDRPAQRDQRLPTRRRPRIFNFVFRSANHFHDRQQYRHVFRATAGHHAIHGNIPHRRLAIGGRAYTDHLVRITISKAQKLVYAIQRRRHHRHAIRPVLVVEVIVDLIQRTAEHDIARLWQRRLNGWRSPLQGLGQPIDNAWQQNVNYLPAQLCLALRHRHTGKLRDGHIRQAKALGHHGSLFEKPRGNNGY